MSINNYPVWPEAGWKTICPLGSGSFGTVYEIQRNEDGVIEKSAMKVLSIPQSDSDISALKMDGYDSDSITKFFSENKNDVLKEYALMQSLNSSNTVICYDKKTKQHDDGLGWDIYIRMELLKPLPDAVSKSKQLSDEEVAKTAYDICNALSSCEKENIIHRDIKPQNIFVSEKGMDKIYKLGDFGVAKVMEGTCATAAGTYEYMAPESNNIQHGGKTIDLYSLGMVMYWLLNERRLPFLPLPPAVPTASQKQDAMRRRFAGEQIPEPAHGSQALKDIVLKACSFDPADRYQSAEEMQSDLSALLPGTKKSKENAIAVSSKAGEQYSYPGEEDTVGRVRKPVLPSDTVKKEKKKIPLAITLLISLLVLCIAAAGAVFFYRNHVDPQEVTEIDAISGNNDIALSWQKAKNALWYEVSYKQSQGQTWTIATEDCADTSWQITELNSGMAYDVRIRSVGKYDVYSDYVYCNGLETKLGVVTGFTAKNLTTSSADLFWDTVEEAEAYDISLRMHDETEWTDYACGVTKNSLSVGDLASGTAYDFRISAVRNGISSEHTFCTGIYTKYEPVTGINPESTTSSSIVLIWNAVPNAEKYNISYKPHGTADWLPYSGMADTATIKVNGLSAGTAYDFRLQAEGEGIASEYTYCTGLYTKYAPVSGVKTEDVTQDTILLKWNASPNAFTYTVEYKEHSENDWIVAKEKLKETSVVISGLSQGTSYDFRITAAGEALPSDYSELKNQYTCYSAVKDLVENCVNTDSVILTWSPVENAAEYRIEYREHETEEWLSASSAEETSATVDSLSSGVAYDFRVCAAGDAPNSEYTYLNSVYTHYEPIAEVEASNIRTSTVSLTWSPVVNAQKYYVEYKESNTETWTKHFPDVAATSVTSLSVTGLKSGTSYDFRICAAGDGKSSEYTYCSGVWTKYPEVKAFTITPQDITAVNLSWEKVSGASSYDVSYRKKGGNSWQTVSDRMSATSTVLNDLEVGSVYEFRIRAVGYAESSDYIYKEYATSLNPVQGFRVNYARESFISLSWIQNADADKYAYSYKLHTDEEWIDCEREISTLSVNVTGLTPGKAYDFRIKAVSGNAESEYTELNNNYTKNMKVVGLKAQEAGENSVKLTWADNSSTNKFEITYGQTGQQARTVNVYGTTYTLKDLKPGEYEIKIQAVGEAPTSEYTAITYKLAKKFQVGDTAFFGSYEQDHAYNNSGKTPIEWQILDIKDGNALLISKYALLSEYFSEREVVVDKNGVTWQGSSLRTNLNGKFYSEAFSSAEKKHIVSTRLSENKEDKYCNRSCLATTDNIFLLSMSEAEKYFKTNAARRCEPSKHVSDGADAVMSGEYCEYWLRSATERIGFSLVVQADGTILEAKGYHQNTRMPVRPALWVEMEGLS